MVSPAGIEPAAYSLGGCRSIRLSYGDGVSRCGLCLNQSMNTCQGLRVGKAPVRFHISRICLPIRVQEGRRSGGREPASSGASEAQHSRQVSPQGSEPYG